MDDKLIRKYFRGECTPGEAAEFIKWLRSNKGESELSAYLDERWDELNYDLSHKPQALQKIHRIINEKELASRRKKYRRLSPVMKVAASVVLIISLLYVFNLVSRSDLLNEPDSHQAEVVTKSTDVGQKLKIYLPDGSTALLNAASGITFTEGFNDTMRIVELAGEAFFEVKKDAGRPFIVKTGDVSTQALGTSFNVRYRPSENKVQVALLSGSVNVNARNDEHIILEPGDLAVFDPVVKKLVKRTWDYKKDFGWKDGILYFNRATLAEVKEKLEIWYGVTIEIHGQTNYGRHFTGSFKNENLQNIMESLSFTFGFSYQQKDSYVSVQF